MAARRSLISLFALSLSLGLASALVVVQPAQAAGAPVGLGTASAAAVLAGTTVINSGPSVIDGDVGVSPGSAVVGFPPGVLSSGVVHAADASAAQSQADVTTAYDDAAGRSTTATVTADLGGQTLVSGVYTADTLGLTGTVTLDGQGDPNAVFVFQSTSTLITASSSVVSLINGASACNVYWQVGSSATLGTDSTFVGTILALTSITATTGASVSGRLLARNGAVTLASNTISNSCGESAPATSTTTAAATATTAVAPAASTPDGLPGTGRSTTSQLLLAGLLVAAGTVLVVRRRHTSTD